MEKWSRNQKLKEIIFKLELNNFDLKILLIYKNGAEGSRRCKTTTNWYCLQRENARSFGSWKI